MSLLKQSATVVVFLLIVAFSACSKPVDDDPSTDPPIDSTNTNPPVNKPDSIRLLTRIQGSGSPGTLQFEYDNENRLVKVIKPYNQASPILTYFFYKSGKLSTVISEDNFQSDKASAVIYYNPNGTCSKIVYKRKKGWPIENPYYYAVSDSNDIDSYDTLIYNSSGQLTKLYTQAVTTSYSKDVRFTFNSASDSIPSQIDQTSYNKDGSVYGRFGLLVYTNNLSHPGLKNMWILYPMNSTVYIAGSSLWVMYPILFDDLGGAEMARYLTFFSKCVTSYKISQNGTWSNGLGGFVYSYSADSSVFRGMVPNAWPAVNAEFTFTKAKK